MNITIVGLGKGGHAIAGYTALLGNDVSVLTHSPIKKQKLEEKNNRIDLTGIIQGSAKINNISMNIEESINNKDFVFLVTDATVHKNYAEKMAPYLIDQNVVLLSPGIGGSLDFYNRVKKINPKTNITVSETDTLPYACKVPKIGISNIKAIKNSIIFTTVPEGKSIENEIQRLYPQFKDMKNPLMGIDDSPVFHICGMLFNSSKIIDGEKFNFYIDGLTPEVTEYMEEMDLERIKVAKALGIPNRNVKDWLNIAYGVEHSNLYNMIQNTPPYRNTKENPNRSPAPSSLNHRYLVEEVLLRAVPTVSIAKVLQVETPKYIEMVNSASALLNRNFWKEGRTIEDMYLTTKEIKNWKYRKNSERI